MSKKRYTFTIITPAYNSEEFIDECIKSVVNANYDLNLVEHIIINDGSIDKTPEIVQRWASQYPHIKLFNKENGNWGSVINYVKRNRLVNNDYVLILDSDDQIVSNAFNIVSDKSRDSDLFVGGFLMTDKKHKFIKVPPYLYVFKRNIMHKNAGNKKAILSCIAIPCNTYFKKDIFYKIDDVKERVSYQDGPLFANISNLSKSARFTYKNVAKYWKYRPGNTMSTISKLDNSALFSQNFFYTCSCGYYETALYWLLGKSSARKYMRDNNIKFPINSKLNFKWMPLIGRWVLWIIYSFWIRKYFERVK